ncbi:MAG: hypothetical protein HYT88_02275 [Candidatus Omnitrophica bacterium]|nr:hypothetical protein [Candidatus Omnitrophota bacterium]
MSTEETVDVSATVSNPVPDLSRMPSTPSHLPDELVNPASSETVVEPAEPEPVQLRAVSTVAETLRISELFMQHIVSGKPHEAFDLMRPYFPISEEEYTRLREEVTKQLELAGHQFGSALESVFASTETAQGILLRHRFIERYTLDAVYWEFVFYKTAEGWMLNRLGFDDRFDPLFE